MAFFKKEMTNNLSLKLEQYISDAKGSTENLELLALFIAGGKLEIKFAL